LLSSGLYFPIARLNSSSRKSRFPKRKLVASLAVKATARLLALKRPFAVLAFEVMLEYACSDNAGHGKKPGSPTACCGDEWQAGVWGRQPPIMAFSLEDAPQLAAEFFTFTSINNR
jgi:hypothetical protein